MGATIDALLKLQRLDLELGAIRQRREKRHRTVRRHKKRSKELEDSVVGMHDQIRHLQVQTDRFELEVKQHDEKISKLRQDLNKAKTNKEYSALLAQINTDKADSSKLENQILAMLGQIDESKTQEEKLKDECRQEAQKSASAEADAKEYEQSTRSQYDKLTRERDAAAEHLAPEIVGTFNRVADRHEGEAMAAIIRVHPKREEYSCSGCNMGLTLEQYNMVQVRDEISMCSSCGRILYIDHTSEALA